LSAGRIHSRRDVNQNQGSGKRLGPAALGQQARDAAERGSDQNRFLIEGLDHSLEVAGKVRVVVATFCIPCAVTMASLVKGNREPAQICECSSSGMPGVSSLATAMDKDDRRAIRRAEAVGMKWVPVVAVQAEG
jgi:hypothetical protein